jgi:hypothetical protein
LTNQLASIGESVAIATNQGPVWAKVEMHPTLRGVVASIFYKPQRLLLAVSLNDGRRLFFNFVPGMAQTGFLLSPFIPDNASFATLATARESRDLAGLQVNSVAIIPASSDGTTRDYHPLVRWEFFHLDYPPQSKN